MKKHTYSLYCSRGSELSAAFKRYLLGVGIKSLTCITCHGARHAASFAKLIYEIFSLPLYHFD